MLYTGIRWWQNLLYGRDVPPPTIQCAEGVDVSVPFAHGLSVCTRLMVTSGHILRMYNTWEALEGLGLLLHFHCVCSDSSQASHVLHYWSSFFAPTMDFRCSFLNRCWVQIWVRPDLDLCTGHLLLYFLFAWMKPAIDHSDPFAQYAHFLLSGTLSVMHESALRYLCQERDHMWQNGNVTELAWKMAFSQWDCRREMAYSLHSFLSLL